MLRTIAFSLLTLIPSAAFALCEGQDLVDAMTDADRAAIQAEADAMPYPTGIYWQATRGDQTITMFGTYHFRHAQTEAHFQFLEPHIEAADAIYLEVSNGESESFMKKLQTDPSIMFISDGPTLPELLSDEDWAKLSDKLNERGFPGFLAAKMKPVWVAVLLGVGPCEMRNAATAGDGIDRLIGKHADTTDNKSRSLEDPEAIFDLLSEEPVEKQIGMIKLSIDAPLDADDLSYTYRKKYLEEEVGVIWALGRQMALKYGGPTAKEDLAKLEDALLVKRNKAWVRILSERPEEAVFVAFGAAHLIGTFGVLYLLEQEGYEITRLELPQ